MRTIEITVSEDGLVEIQAVGYRGNACLKATEALFNAFDENMEPSEMHIGAAIQNTVPLSKTMAGTIEALRQWAQGRARRASPLINPMAQTQRKLMNN